MIREDSLLSDQETPEWTTSEAAKHLGVSPSLVRTWISYLNWEVRRNAEGHRIFGPEDVAQLEKLKAWLDDGHTLKAFRRERQGEGPYDPRLELRASARRLRELTSQQEALLERQKEVVALYAAERQALLERVESVEAVVQSSTRVVAGVLKQLLTSVMEKQGKLSLVRRYQEDDKIFLEYVSPSGKRQLIQDWVVADEDRRLLDTVLALVLAESNREA